MKAINLPHFKNKLRDLSRELFLDHGWVLPDGLATYGNKSPLNFTLEEWQQAKRQGLDPREIKQAFQQAWERCDSQVGFKNALEDRGYFLARGDRRGFVALDVDGNVYCIIHDKPACAATSDRRRIQYRYGGESIVDAAAYSSALLSFASERRFESPLSLM